MEEREVNVSIKSIDATLSYPPKLMHVPSMLAHTHRETTQTSEYAPSEAQGPV